MKIVPVCTPSSRSYPYREPQLKKVTPPKTTLETVDFRFLYPPHKQLVHGLFNTCTQILKCAHAHTLQPTDDFCVKLATLHL